MSVDMNTEHQEKIDKAIQFCQSTFKKFCSALEEFYGKEEADELALFFLQNTYFAGGVFRSIFSDQPVNDIDVFFRSEDAVVEFKDRFLQTKSIFPDDCITSNDTFMYKFGGRQPYLSFVTRDSGEPDELLGWFDFSFNMHYYSIQDGRFLFDMDTFNKSGRINNFEKNPINTLFRAYRFAKDGFRIQQADLIPLLQHLVKNNNVLKESDIVKDITYANTGNPYNARVDRMMQDDEIRLTGWQLTDDELISHREENNTSPDTPPTWGEAPVAQPVQPVLTEPPQIYVHDETAGTPTVTACHLGLLE